MAEIDSCGTGGNDPNNDVIPSRVYKVCLAVGPCFGLGHTVRCELAKCACWLSKLC